MCDKRPLNFRVLEPPSKPTMSQNALTWSGTWYWLLEKTVELFTDDIPVYVTFLTILTSTYIVSSLHGHLTFLRRLAQCWLAISAFIYTLNFIVKDSLKTGKQKIGYSEELSVMILAPLCTLTVVAFLLDYHHRYLFQLAAALSQLYRSLVLIIVDITFLGVKGFFTQSDIVFVIIRFLGVVVPCMLMANAFENSSFMDTIADGLDRIFASNKEKEEKVPKKEKPKRVYGDRSAIPKKKVKAKAVVAKT